MEALEVAFLVEFSEARAYKSLIQAAPQPFLDEHGLRVFTIDSAVAVVAESVTNTLNMNRVIGLGLVETATEAMVDQIVEIYAERGIAFGIEIGPFARPQELPGWLRKRRIRRSVVTALHYRAAERIEVREGPVLVVQASNSEREIVADICCSVFRMPGAAHALIAGTADNPEWRQWLAYLGNRPIAAALSFVRDGVGWLGWAATLPEFRGRGAQSSLIVHRVNEAAGAGCKYVTTETAVNAESRADPSYRNCDRLGFSLAYERATYVAVRGANGKRPEEG
jgi:GNAT superfamily N-acetyltransferase